MLIRVCYVFTISLCLQLCVFRWPNHYLRWLYDASFGVCICIVNICLRFYIFFLSILHFISRRPVHLHFFWRHVHSLVTISGVFVLFVATFRFYIFSVDLCTLQLQFYTLVLLLFFSFWRPVPRLRFQASRFGSPFFPILHLYDDLCTLWRIYSGDTVIDHDDLKSQRI